jgi:hypothetical protein
MISQSQASTMVEDLDSLSFWEALPPSPCIHANLMAFDFTNIRVHTRNNRNAKPA